jgi:hypothetical protein
MMYDFFFRTRLSTRLSTCLSIRSTRALRTLVLPLSLLLLCLSAPAQAQTFNVEFGSSITSKIGGDAYGALAIWFPIIDRVSGYASYTRWNGNNTNKQRYLDPTSGIVVANTTGPIFWGNQAFTAQVLYAPVKLEFFRLHVGGGVFVHEMAALDNINANTARPQFLRERSEFAATFTASLIAEYVHSQEISIPLRFFYAGPGFITEARHFGCSIGVGVRLWQQQW